jgi:HK97 family phage major capsid protein
MIMLARERTFAQQECTILPMGSNSLKVPSELTGVSVTWDDEAGAIDESEGTFGQVTLTAKRMNAYSLISNEMLADSQIDIVGLLADQFGYAGALELDNEIINGNGTKLMSGVTTAAAGYSVVLASGSTNFSAQTAINYSDAIYRLAEADAANAKFKINRISSHYLRSLRDDNGQHIYVQPAAGNPGTIWGTPAKQCERITSTSAVSTAFAVLGDWKGVYLGRRMAFGSLDVDPYGAFLTYQTRYRFVSRWAGALSRSTKFVRMITAGS